MEKNLLQNDEFEEGFLVNLSSLSNVLAALKKSKEMIAIDHILHDLRDKVEERSKCGDPSKILNLERHCEQFDLANFAKTTQEVKSNIQTLRMIQSAQTDILALSNPKQYKADLAFDVGEENMDKIESAPPDAVHLLVKSQTQKLLNAAGRIKFPAALGYFRVRREALKEALRLHKEKCEEVLGINRKTQSHEHER